MKIIVDKLPESCAKCIFYDFKMQHVGDYGSIPITNNTETCILCKTKIPGSVADSVRLNTCPLTSLCDIRQDIYIQGELGKSEYNDNPAAAHISCYK